MIDDPVLDRLAAADPAARVDPAPDEVLLARLLAAPRGRRRRVRGRVLGAALAVAAAAAVALVLAGLPAEEREVAPPVAQERELAPPPAVPVDPDAVVHTVVETDSTETSASGVKRRTGRLEEWHRGDETHRLTRYFAESGRETAALDHVIDAHGVMRQVDLGGGYRIIRGSDNEDATNVIVQERAGWVADFRRRALEGVRDPADDVAFAGRPAIRYRVTVANEGVDASGRRVPMPDGPEQAYYFDRETGAPLGLTSELRMNMADGNGGSTPTTLRVVQTVRTLESLPPTDENLAKLRELTLPRRRDANGCIRGAAAAGKSSESASRSDCGGGPPGAPIG